MENSLSTEDQYALSPMQQGMLFYTLYDRQAGLYVDHAIFDLAGHDLNLAAFQRAWESVVARHPSLRTSFHWEGLEAPVQRVRTSVDLPFHVEDWRHIPLPQQEERLDAYVRSDRSRGFVLTDAPLTRLALFRIGEDHTQCVWTIHHLLADGRSAIVILQEVFALYDAFSNGTDLHLPPSRPYREYIDWLEKQDHRAAETFWRRALNGFTAPTPLVVDRPIEPLRGSPRDGQPMQDDIGFQEACLRGGTTATLAALAARHLLSLNTFVEGAWALLLNRYSGEDDVVFGEVRAGRRSTFDGADAIVGVFMNTVPVRIRVPADARLLQWLKGLRLQQVPVLKYEHAPLVDVQRWSEVPPGTPLFDSVLDFTDFSLNATLRGLGSQWQKSTFHVREKTNYALMVYAVADPELRLKIGYDRRRFDGETVRRMLDHLATLLEGMAANPDGRVVDLPLLTRSEQHQILVAWNETASDYPRQSCIHQLIEAQVARTPDAPAVCIGGQELTYRELNARANQLARHLATIDVRPGTRIGLCVERSLEMMVALLGVLKAGAAYVPLDPSYPNERLAFILDDAGVDVLITEERLAKKFGPFSRTTIYLDTDVQTMSRERRENLDAMVSSEDLAYVMYTSGSTGKPKGVRVRHRNVVNFFAGMDERLGADHPGVWLAVTSISFDISVLELFWTLSRGFKVVLQRGDDMKAPTLASHITAATNARRKPAEFSLFYFACSDTNSSNDGSDKYRLLLEGAKFADAHGFSAVWTPERHFHPFGGLYPNPSVTSAALAAITTRVHVRGGSVVLPLQHPIRVAEEWSVVDNLSGGRAGVSFASGWHVNDFVFAPANFADRKQIMRRDVEQVRRLWRGESVTAVNGTGRDVDVRIYPRPVQPELPVWITAAGDPETFRVAGEIGANLLTHLLGSTVEGLADQIAIYRKAWRDHGHGREGREGTVTLMLHTFVGADLAQVRETVRQPLLNYLRTASDLARKLASSVEQDRALTELSDADMNDLHERAFERFFSTGGFLGTPETCLAMIRRLEEIGVDEIACLIDFGVDFDSVMASLTLLNRVRETNLSKARERGDDSVAAQIAAHGVTHFQCTPSMARMLAMRPESLAALRPLRKMLLGGEALPDDLADRFSGVVSGDVLNMYGPTETTVWSTIAAVDGERRPVPIGRPIANTRIYILDRFGRPVPVGVSGELFIGGDGVTAGYHNRPELTAERFVDDRFSPEAGGRLYRTGDVARYRADGGIEFLGRVDHQVKIRGHRIELGEIETALQRYPGVREAVVVAREDRTGDQRLVAYVASAPGASITVDALRDHLRTTLPKEMVPAAFVTLASLPRTPNGKLDRRSLPAPDQVRSGTERSFVAPRTTVETQLSRLWEKVLRVRPIGVTDNFFELGGHSLLAVSLFAQIEKTFGRSLPLATLFQGATIEQLARILEQNDLTPSWSPLVPIQPHGTRPPLFFMHAEGGNVLEYYALARRLGTDQPFYALQSDLLNGHRYQGVTTPRLEELAARYVREIRRVQPAGPYFIGGWCLGGYLAYEAAQQLEAQGQRVALLAMVHTVTPDYPRMRPDVTFVRRLLYRTIKRLDLEWSNLEALAGKARIRQVAGRVTRLLTLAQLKAERLIDPWLTRLNLGDRHSLEYKLEAIGTLHKGIVLNYTVKPYAGEGVTLFRASKQLLGIVPDQTMGWGALLNGHLEVHEVHAHRENILIEPAVGSLAQQLNACVDRASRKVHEQTRLTGRRAS
ncbi:MAG TPA: MupA/Atu3671 family FMN-dependent luciferase-like monooxygenase [Vicinamibacterales bacterium]|jgi:natural product biosynthesis luciferase-like monooxygenase protein